MGFPYITQEKHEREHQAETQSSIWTSEPGMQCAFLEMSGQNRSWFAKVNTRTIVGKENFYCLKFQHIFGNTWYNVRTLGIFMHFLHMIPLNVVAVVENVIMNLDFRVTANYPPMAIYTFLPKQLLRVWNDDTPITSGTWILVYVAC